MRFSFLPYFLLLFSSSSLFAQVTSDIGRFQVQYGRGCAPFTVTIDDNSGSTVSVFDYGDGSPQTIDTVHTYDIPGSYTIQQIIQNATPRTDQLTVQVIESRIPSFQIYQCENNTIRVTIEDQYYDRFGIDYGDGTIIELEKGQLVPEHQYAIQGSYTVRVTGLFLDAADNCGFMAEAVQTIDQIEAPFVSSLQVSNLNATSGTILLNFQMTQPIPYFLEYAVNSNTDFVPLLDLTQSTSSLGIDTFNTVNNTYCFRIMTLDSCTSQRVYSNIVSSINLEVAAEQNQITADWDGLFAFFQAFDLYRDGVQIASINDFNQRSYNDLDITCGQIYRYQLENRYSNGAISISAEVEQEGLSVFTPAGISDLTATVDGENININVTTAQPTAVQYYLERSAFGGGFSQIDSSSTASFIDSDVSVNSNRYCYRISYRDNCNNFSEESNLACPVLLGGAINGAQVDLNWTPYQGWDFITGQTLEVYDFSGQLLNQNNLGSFDSNSTFTIPTNQKGLQFRIRSTNGLSESLSNFISFELSPEVYLPNSFTPDGDGLNDIFKAKGRFLSTFEMLVFNRWGEIIFQSDNIDRGWDGTYNGKDAKDGSYVYQVRYILTDGKTEKQSGAIYLLRH